MPQVHASFSRPAITQQQQLFWSLAEECCSAVYSSLNGTKRKEAAVMIKITLQLPIRCHSVIAKIFKATSEEMFFFTWDQITQHIMFKFKVWMQKCLLLCVCGDMRSRGFWPYELQKVPSVSPLRPPFIPPSLPPFLFLIQISHSMPCTCFSVIWTLAENFKQLSRAEQSFFSSLAPLFERTQSGFQVHLIRRSRDGDYDMQMTLCYQRWHSLWSRTEER